jgi:hypothetical protein
MSNMHSTMTSLGPDSSESKYLMVVAGEQWVVQGEEKSKYARQQVENAAKQ